MSAGFRLQDFAPLLREASKRTELVLVGGQAVAFWAQRYADRLTEQCRQRLPLVSKDIDFWGDAEVVRALARSAHARPVFPHPYERTSLAGIVKVKVHDQETVMEVLTGLLGLDASDPADVAQPEVIAGIRLQILEPVSLLHTKVHGLVSYDQKERNDRFHMEILFTLAGCFVEELMSKGELEPAMWQTERVFKLSEGKNGRKLLQREQLSVLEAVPHAHWAEAAARADRSAKVHRFWRERARRVYAKAVEAGWRPARKWTFGAS